MCYGETPPLRHQIGFSMPSARRAEAAGERWQTLIYHHGRARSGVGGHGLESVVRAGYVIGPLSAVICYGLWLSPCLKARTHMLLL